MYLGNCPRTSLLVSIISCSCLRSLPTNCPAPGAARPTGRRLTGAPSGERPRDFFAPPLSLEQLAAAQGVGPVTDFESMLGDFWPEQETTEEFLATLRTWRSASAPSGRRSLTHSNARVG